MFSRLTGFSNMEKLGEIGKRASERQSYLGTNTHRQQNLRDFSHGET
jgi:hypothetical protein